MMKATTLSLFSGGLLAAGFAYAYAKQARIRRSEAESSGRARAMAFPGDPELQSFDDALSAGEADEIELEIELVDLDAMTDDDEAYDAISPDDLGALWLSRATQTSGVRASPGIEGVAFGEDDDVDPAGRPTDPPGEPVAPKHPRANDG